MGSGGFLRGNWARTHLYASVRRTLAETSANTGFCRHFLLPLREKKMQIESCCPLSPKEKMQIESLYPHQTANEERHLPLLVIYSSASGAAKAGIRRLYLSMEDAEFQVM